MMKASDPAGKIPVTLITGFLGSGKTTLLRAMLARDDLAGSAVLINEFGDIAIDDSLVRSRAAEVITLESGCLCCSLRDGLAFTLGDLEKRVAAGAIPPFHRVLVETTGLADPAPIVNALAIDPALTAGYYLASTVVTVDAVQGWAGLDRQPEAVRQVAIADHLLLTKTDLAAAADIARLEDRLRALNPGAEMARVIAGAIERLAVEIRHLQRSEVGEAAEAFGKGQKGSSAMPHKKNPILSENLTGLARIVRASVVPALENIALWHERDISHSAVERVFAPDATIALDFALTRLAAVVDGLVVDEAAMRRNLESRGGLVHSQRVLLALIERGMSREDAYATVQKIALEVWEGGGHFEAALAADERVAAVLDRAGLAALFAPEPYLKHVDTIFERVFGRSTDDSTDKEGSGRS